MIPWNEIASGIGMAGGVWALVRWTQERRNGNGHSTDGGSQSEPALKYLVDRMDTLCNHAIAENERAIQLLEQAREPQPEPAWLAALETRFADAQTRQERFLEAGRYKETAAAIERVVDRLEAILQMGPPNITVEAPPPDLSTVEKRMDRLIQQVSRLMTPHGFGGDGEVTAPRTPGPITLNPNPVHLEIFNTVHAEEWEILELVPPETDLYYLSFLNLGPGHIYMRQDEPPQSLDDPHSTTIPSGSGDNTINTPKHIYVLADEGGATMSIRLSYTPAT